MFIYKTRYKIGQKIKECKILFNCTIIQYERVARDMRLITQRLLFVSSILKI